MQKMQELKEEVKTWHKTYIKMRTDLENIPRGAEWITSQKKRKNYQRAIITLGKECWEYCDVMEGQTRRLHRWCTPKLERMVQLYTPKVQ